MGDHGWHGWARISDFGLMSRWDKEAEERDNKGQV